MHLNRFKLGSRLYQGLHLEVLQFKLLVSDTEN